MFEHHDKDYWLYNIKKEDNHIFSLLTNIENKERKDIAEEIIVSLRHFTQNIQCFIRETKNPKKFDTRYKEEEQADNFCKSNYQYNFLSEFLSCLNSSVGHQSIYGEYAERLIQKYFYYLIKIKKLLKEEFYISILENLEKYPIDLDNSFLNYYQKILNGFKNLRHPSDLKSWDQYYVQKKKAIFVDNVLFYEYTLTNANDSVTRFDRFTAFSLLDIYPNYCIKAKIVMREITYLDVLTPYFFVIDYVVSIRVCELQKLGEIMNLQGTYNKTIGYEELMKYIQNNRISINDLMTCSNEYYKMIVYKCFRSERKEKLLILLDKVRQFVNSKKDGWKTISYLIYHLNNSVLKRQMAFYDNDCFGSTKLSKKVYPFETNPFSSSLIKHRPKLSDLCEIFSIKEYHGEYLARIISSLSNETESIFLPKKDFISDADVIDILKYNDNFVKDEYFGRKIIIDDSNVFLQENKDYTEYIIKMIKKKTNQETYPYFSSYVKVLIDEKQIVLDDLDKKNALLRCFNKKSAFVVYGPAGSGKSYFAKLLVDLLPELDICCIALTNPAVENIRQKIGMKNASFMTINKFLNNDFNEYDLLIIDECSTISARDMKSILEHGRFKMLLLCGDVYQIQSIEFGNWFSLLKYFVDKDAIVDLNNQFRSSSEVLQNVWKATRNLEKSLQELLDVDEISHEIDESIFNKQNEDEIVLCLNYDGLYGINNINKILQCKNFNKGIKWKQYTFKINDPILFYETKRFSNVFHNNMKGKILDVSQDENSIYFKICVYSTISTLLLENAKIKFYCYDNGKTIVGFSVYKPTENEYDYDSKLESHIPFQISYAVSIHKAQGLEFESVKIVISNEVEERITHNIFYTAITRAKKYLTIYWSPKTEETVIRGFSLYNCKRDANIMSIKCTSLKMVKKK